MPEDKKPKINQTSSNVNIEQLDKNVSELIAETDEGSSIDNNKVYAGLKINATKMEEQSKHPDRSNDWSIKRGIASIVMKFGKAIGLSIGNDTKFSIDRGSISSISQTHRIKANRIYLDCDELIINGHKLNNRIIELADFRELPDKPNSIIGDFMVRGTVLVKSWEPNLGRYVLIRREIFMPLFGQSTTAVEIAPGLKIKDPTKLVTDFAPFTKSMLAGNFPITEKSAKEALQNANPKAQQILNNNIYEMKVSDYKTYDEFKSALDTKKKTVIEAFNKQIEKGNVTAKNSVEQAEQAYDLLLKNAQAYYEKLGK
jgi:hypothetical protein|nr:MAG TPA: hypothetical protein [Caudoviricetes sp.]